MKRDWRRIAPVAVIVTAMVLLIGGPARATGVQPSGSLTCTDIAERVWYSPSLWESNPSQLSFNWHADGTVIRCTGNTGDTIVWFEFSLSGSHPGPRTCTSAFFDTGYAGGGVVHWRTIDQNTKHWNYTSHVTLTSEVIDLTGLLSTVWSVSDGPFAGNTIHVKAQVDLFPSSHCSATSNATGLWGSGLSTPLTGPAVTIP